MEYGPFLGSLVRKILKIYRILIEPSVLVTDRHLHFEQPVILRDRKAGQTLKNWSKCK